MTIKEERTDELGEDAYYHLKNDRQIRCIGIRTHTWNQHNQGAHHLHKEGHRGICASVWTTGCKNHQICTEYVVDAHETDVTPEMRSCPHTVCVPYVWLLLFSLVTVAQEAVTEGGAHFLSVPKYTVISYAYSLDLHSLQTLSQPVNVSLVYTSGSQCMQIFCMMSLQFTLLSNLCNNVQFNAILHT